MPDEKLNLAGEARGAVKSAADRNIEEMGLGQVNFVKEALRWQYNWIGLAGAALFAMVSGTGLPLVLAAGLELIYLSLVPQSSAFRRLVRSWKFAEEKRRHQLKLSTMLDELPKELRGRYEDVCRICVAIRANYGRLSSTAQVFMSQADDRLSGLLQSYLRLLHSAYQHREYLRTTSPDAIKREIAQLGKDLASDSPKVQEINRRRIEILTKRVEKYQKVRENQQVIDAQCSAIEDVLELIRDQSVTLRDPQQLSDQLENLVHDVEQTEQTVREVEAIFEMAAPEMNHSLEELAGRVEAPAAPAGNPRPRLRN
jgi:hypothetical protein